MYGNACDALTSRRIDESAFYGAAPGKRDVLVAERLEPLSAPDAADPPMTIAVFCHERVCFTGSRSTTTRS